MGSQDWKGLSDFLAVIAIILIFVGAIAYFYQTTYVTILGNFNDYPYRGYVLGIAIGVGLCFVGSFAAEQIANNMRTEEIQNATIHTLTVTKRTCPYCGTKVSPNYNFCPNCAQRIR